MSHLCLQHFLNFGSEMHIRECCVLATQPPSSLPYQDNSALGTAHTHAPFQPRTASKDAVSTQVKSYPGTIKSDSSPIACLSKSLNFPLFPINSHYKNIVLVQVEFFPCFITLALFFFFELPSAISAMSTHHLPCSFSAFSNNLHIMEQPEGV